MALTFDLITVDVAEPRLTAAAIMADNPELAVELDEDDGRWLVLASANDQRRFGLQRSDAREVAARIGTIDDVLDGCITLSVADIDIARSFFSDAVGLSVAGDRLEFNGAPVIELVAAPPLPSNLHLDFACQPEEFSAEIARLLDHRATRIGPPHSAVWGASQVFVAPAGGVFCLNAYVD